MNSKNGLSTISTQLSTPIAGEINIFAYFTFTLCLFYFIFSSGRKKIISCRDYLIVHVFPFYKTTHNRTDREPAGLNYWLWHMMHIQHMGTKEMDIFWSCRHGSHQRARPKGHRTGYVYYMCSHWFSASYIKVHTNSHSTWRNTFVKAIGHGSQTKGPHDPNTLSHGRLICD